MALVPPVTTDGSPRAGLLSSRALGRALLARQHLLERVRMPAEAMIEHLVGLQAQAPNPPYLGLWSRLSGFGTAELGTLLEERRAVRVVLMRSTIHLVSARDCLWLRPLLQQSLDRGFRSSYGKHLQGLDLDQVAAAGRELVEERPRTFQQLGALLGERWPGRDTGALAQVVRAGLPLVQVPPRGVWGLSGPAAHTTAQHWLGRPLAADPPAEDLVLRYLAAFGPATVQDIQKWAGVTRLGKVVAGLRPDLVAFRDEQGRELLDLPGAPRPPEDTPVPVRLIAPFDNLLLSHADRSRVLPPAWRNRVMTVNGIVLGTLLVDGLVAGTWRIAEDGDTATLTVTAFAPLSRGDRGAAELEGAQLLAFAAAGSAVHRCIVEAPDRN